MNKINVLIIILLIFSLITCSSSGKIKESPQEGAWEICPLCKGTGKSELKSGVNSADDIHRTEKENDSCVLTYLGWIFFTAFADEENNGNEDLSKDEPDRIKNGAPAYPGEKSIERMEQDLPQRSTVTKKVRCPRCAGIGWIEEEDRPLTPEEKHLQYETYKQITEEINRKK